MKYGFLKKELEKEGHLKITEYLPGIHRFLHHLRLPFLRKTCSQSNQMKLMIGFGDEN